MGGEAIGVEARVCKQSVTLNDNRGTEEEDNYQFQVIASSGGDGWRVVASDGRRREIRTGRGTHALEHMRGLP